MTKSFITDFKGLDGLIHIYFCPGKSAISTALTKAVLVDAEYRFTLKQDSSIEYVVLNSKREDGTFDAKVTNSDGEEKIYNFKAT